MTTTQELQQIELANLPAQTQAAQVMSMLERVLTAPNFDMDRAERLWAMQKEVRAEQARAAFVAANSAMQGELPSIVKKGKIKNNAGLVQSTYALWEDVNEGIKPVLMKHNFALSFLVDQPDKNTVVVTGILSHADGHKETTTLTLAPDTSGSKNSVQAVGSAISYGKRYTAGALLNLVSHGEDDDGQAAGAQVDTDEVMAKVADLESNIMEATDKAGLDKTKADLLTAKLPPRLHRRVKLTYNARVAQLREEHAKPSA